MAKRCGHCGREGTLESVKSVVLSREEATVLTNGRQEMGAERQRIIDVQRCQICGGPTFSTYSWLDPFFDSREDVTDETVFYPPQHDVADLPERVRTRYVSALALLHAPDAFAVRAGRMLEAICADQGVAGGTLHDRLTELASSGDLPLALTDQAHLVREYRNLGGHDADLEVEEADVPLIRGFMEALLEFLYWGPAKLARGNAELQKRRDALKRTSPT